MVRMGIAEPNAGSDALALATSAKKDGGDYVINGAKVCLFPLIYLKSRISIYISNIDG